MITLQPLIATKVFLLRVLYLGFPKGGIRLVRFWYEKPSKGVSGSVVWVNFGDDAIFFKNMASPN